MVKKSVLVIEDSEYIARVIAANFGPDYECTLCGDPRKVLGDIRCGRRPDAIIMSLNKSGMSALEFLQELHSDRAADPVPVVVISSEKTSAVRVRLFKAGADDFVVKPFNPEELVLRVARCIG